MNYIYGLFEIVSEIAKNIFYPILYHDELVFISKLMRLGQGLEFRINIDGSEVRIKLML